MIHVCTFVHEDHENDVKLSDLSVVQDISSVYQIFADEVLGSGQFGIVYGGESHDRKHICTESTNAQIQRKQKTCHAGASPC